MALPLVRVRLLLSKYGTYLAAGLVAVALLGGFLAYPPYADPGTEVREFEESSWSSTAAFSHQATVVEQTEIFDEGEVLSNRTSYFESVAPVLNGTFRYGYEASSDGDMAVETNLSLVVRSADEDVEYWREESELTSVSEGSVGPGETVSAPFSVNVTAVNQRIELIEEQLGGTPGSTEIVVRSQLALSGERNGQRVTDESTHEMTISPQSNVYSVGGAEPATDSGQQFGRETVEASYGPLRTVGGPLLVVVSLLGLVGLAVGRSQGWFSVSGEQRDWTAYQQTRSEFEEWITGGDVPSEVLDKTAIEVDSLEGLVDVAIDSDRRVIADRSRGLCVVVLEDAVYRYEPPARPDGADPLEAGEPAMGPGGTLSNDGIGSEDDVESEDPVPTEGSADGGSDDAS